MRASAGLILICLAAGCRTRPPGAPAGGAVPAADSIVLERTRCFGTCPAYRLSLARSGVVRFHSRNPGDEAREASGTVSPGAFEGLVQQAARLGFWSLPDQIAGSALCERQATDHPTATVTLFGRRGAKRVEDYLGCFDAPQELRRFETAIDSVAGSRQWVRPSAIR